MESENLIHVIMAEHIQWLNEELNVVAKQIHIELYKDDDISEDSVIKTRCK